MGGYDVCNKDCLNCIYIDCIAPENDVDLSDMDFVDKMLDDEISEKMAHFHETIKFYKYNHSEKGKASQKKYNESELGRLRAKKYNASAKGKARFKKYKLKKDGRTINEGKKDRSEYFKNRYLREKEKFKQYYKKYYIEHKEALKEG